MFANDASRLIPNNAFLISKQLYFIMYTFFLKIFTFCRGFFNWSPIAQLIILNYQTIYRKIIIMTRTKQGHSRVKHSKLNLLSCNIHLNIHQLTSTINEFKSNEEVL